MSQIKNNYDSIAWMYDFLSNVVFLNRIQKSQLAFLNKIPDNSAILIIGGGTGYLLQKILQLKGNLRIVYVDASIKMIEKAKLRIKSLDKGNKQRVEFIYGTEKDIPPSYTFDCICTHFFLDLFNDVEMKEIMTRLTQHSKPNSQWQFADFQNSNSIFQKALLRIMFLFFRLTTNSSVKSLPNYLQSFKQLGWEELDSIYYYNKMIKCGLYIKHE